MDTDEKEWRSRRDRRALNILVQDGNLAEKVGDRHSENTHKKTKQEDSSTDGQHGAAELQSRGQGMTGNYETRERRERNMTDCRCRDEAGFKWWAIQNSNL